MGTGLQLREVLLKETDPQRRRALYGRMDPYSRKLLIKEFADWASPGQLQPPGDWRTWLIMAGRGFGKTRAGAEWITRLARRPGKRRFALVGATMAEARAVMVEGPSGLLATADPLRMPKWEPSLGRLRFRSGAEAFIYSADNAEALRGPEHQYAWCDELAKWNHDEAAWSNLMLGLRAGPHQRVLVTTTPRPTRLLKSILADPATVRTGGRTADNPFLPEEFVGSVSAIYGGTGLGRQELDGELIEDREGALWTRAGLEACRLILPGTGRWHPAGLTEGRLARSRTPPHRLRRSASPSRGGV